MRVKRITEVKRIKRIRRIKRIIKIRIVAGDKFIEHEGISYRLKRSVEKNGHCECLIFEEYSPSQHRERLGRIAEKLLADSGLTTQDVLENSLQDLDLDSIKRIEKMLREGKKAAL